MKGGNVKALALTSSPTDSKLFQMFAKGCESRMGKLVMQELALPFEALCDILLHMKSELLSVETTVRNERGSWLWVGHPLSLCLQGPFGVERC